MSDDWQPGDVALCVNASGHWAGPVPLKKDREYIVAECFIGDGFSVFDNCQDMKERLVLRLVGCPNPLIPHGGYDARRFVKQQPRITKEQVEAENKITEKV